MMFSNDSRVRFWHLSDLHLMLARPLPAGPPNAPRCKGRDNPSLGKPRQITGPCNSKRTNKAI